MHTRTPIEVSSLGPSVLTQRQSLPFDFCAKDKVCSFPKTFAAYDQGTKAYNIALLAAMHLCYVIYIQ